MKRVVTIIAACLLLYFNGFTQCTPNAPTGNPGLTPAPSSVTCIERGVPYDFTLYFENFSSFNCSNFTADVNSATIDNLSNLPCGITWQADQSSYAAGETGCIRITGTSTDVVGQYPLEVTMTFDLDIFGSSYPVSGTIAQLQQQLQQFSCSSPSVNTDYYSRVIDPGNSCPSIGSSSDRNSSGAICPSPSIGVSISGNTTICSGSSTTLTANVSNATGAVTYSWNPGGGSGQTVSVSPTSTVTYSVTVTDQNGSATASVTVTVIQQCDDNDACTTDNCVSNSCVFTPNAPCNDNDACTTDNCVPASGCVFTQNAPCNDNDACTTDNCVPATGCVYTPIAPCNDNDACTTDNCVPATGCVYTPIAPCNDNDACTTDNCVPATGCVYTPIAPCNDNDACTTDNCVPATGCVYAPVICDDSDVCTTDNCNPATGCEWSPIPNCTDPCDTLVCDDGDLCTTDTCMNGQCEYTAIICDDADTCTTDNCVPATGCVFTPITTCNVGIHNTDNSLSVEIYPNPNSGIFELKLNSINKGQFLLYVLDLSGKHLYSEIFTGDHGSYLKQVDMSSLPKGIYMISLRSEQIIVNNKLVIY